MNTVTAFPSSSLRVVALAGSPTPGSRSTALLHAALEQLRPVTDSAHLIELRALPPGRAAGRRHHATRAAAGA
jgi:NAD(P)H-dependent FMN reductase